MTDIELENEHTAAQITTSGGAIWRLAAKLAHEQRPLLREPPAGNVRGILNSACFPLVPFGNRVRGNRFTFEGKDYTLTPNRASDKHYLHGDGWTSEWTIADRDAVSVTLALQHRGSPYTYDAQQRIRLVGRSIEIALTVANRGEHALPFGLGLHPYFPLTPRTRLTAVADAYWEEDAQFLPTTRRRIAGDLDFSAGAPIPRRWINTLFEGWNGRARIVWPENQLSLVLEAGAPFDRYLVFVSDPSVDATYAFESFCFEPMTHAVDAHNRIDGGGLKRLAPGESLSGTVRFIWNSS